MVGFSKQKCRAISDSTPRFTKYPLIWMVISSMLFTCGKKQQQRGVNESLFSLVPSEQTGIDFTNTLEQNFSFNFLIYQYVYNGGGVAAGDINNDGLVDVYITGNQTANKLYLNRGGFEFEDITSSAGVTDDTGWTTGVSMIDINADGLLDIHVCKSGSLKDPRLRRNKLYINQGNQTFKEEAKSWGVDHSGFGVQSYFFDYDKDGDLDMYLVNHRQDFQNTRRIDDPARTIFNSETSDQLFRNDGTFFTNVTKAAGVENKAWGLSASIGDFNNDGWPDVYVANDYIQPDMMYINNHDGTFSNEVLERLPHISYNSMGSDFADLNNDLLPDLLVLDMLAEDHGRSKENMATMNPKGFQLLVESGYHHTYMANMLHLNRGNGEFSEVGQLAGISKTDWSWAPLIADFDNDGHKDVFITNGIERDLSNQDYQQKLQAIIRSRVDMPIEQVEQMMPAHKLSNYVFRNNGKLSFEKKMEAWGLDKPMNTNGVAYADLDNDGDLDLVLNNMSEKAAVYQNHSTKNYLSISLKGDKMNPQGIGASVTVYSVTKAQHQINYLTRGYQSSVTDVLNFGLADELIVDSVQVIWPDKSRSVVREVKSNQRIVIEKEEAVDEWVEPLKTLTYFREVDPTLLGIDFVHKQNNVDDFAMQPLLPQKQSTLGSGMAVGDLNNDGLEDFYVGGARGQTGVFYFQNAAGQFDVTNAALCKRDQVYEDQGVLFFDLENDGDLDVYLTSGGYELKESDVLLQDRLYLNDGSGKFEKSNGLPEMLTSTKQVAASDFDGDGDLDLFVGGRLVPGTYPLAPRSYVLENMSDGSFRDVTDQVAPVLRELGLVNDLLFTDYDQDGDEDLIVVGEWMPITFLENQKSLFKPKELPFLKNTEGWWNVIKAIDINMDGVSDYLVGNLGENNKFHPTAEKPLHIYGSYFDENNTYDMVLSKEYRGSLVPVRGKECSSEQNPFIGQKIATYQDFANATLEDIYGREALEEAYHREVKTFSSKVILSQPSGGFLTEDLPKGAQMGPSMDYAFLDIDGDGQEDVVGVGAILDTEVETIRYDANAGYALLGRADAELVSLSTPNLRVLGDAKSVKLIMIKGEVHLMIATNGRALQLFKLNIGSSEK